MADDMLGGFSANEFSAQFSIRLLDVFRTASSAYAPRSRAGVDIDNSVHILNKILSLVAVIAAARSLGGRKTSAPSGKHQKTEAPASSSSTSNSGYAPKGPRQKNDAESLRRYEERMRKRPIDMGNGISDISAYEASRREIAARKARMAQKAALEREMRTASSSGDMLGASIAWRKIMRLEDLDRVGGRGKRGYFERGAKAAQYDLDRISETVRNGGSVPPEARRDALERLRYFNKGLRENYADVRDGVLSDHRSRVNQLARFRRHIQSDPSESPTETKEEAETRLRKLAKQTKRKLDSDLKVGRISLEDHGNLTKTADEAIYKGFKRLKRPEWRESFGSAREFFTDKAQKGANSLSGAIASFGTGIKEFPKKFTTGTVDFFKRFRSPDFRRDMANSLKMGAKQFGSVMKVQGKSLAQTAAKGIGSALSKFGPLMKNHIGAIIGAVAIAGSVISGAVGKSIEARDEHRLLNRRLANSGVGTGEFMTTSSIANRYGISSQQEQSRIEREQQQAAMALWGRGGLNEKYGEWGISLWNDDGTLKSDKQRMIAVSQRANEIKKTQGDDMLRNFMAHMGFSSDQFDYVLNYAKNAQISSNTIADTLELKLMEKQTEFLKTIKDDMHSQRERVLNAKYAESWSTGLLETVKNFIYGNNETGDENTANRQNTQNDLFAKVKSGKTLTDDELASLGGDDGRFWGASTHTLAQTKAGTRNIEDAIRRLVENNESIAGVYSETDSEALKVGKVKALLIKRLNEDEGVSLDINQWTNMGLDDLSVKSGSNTIEDLYAGVKRSAGINSVGGYAIANVKSLEDFNKLDLTNLSEDERAQALAKYTALKKGLNTEEEEEKFNDSNLTDTAEFDEIIASQKRGKLADIEEKLQGRKNKRAFYESNLSSIQKGLMKYMSEQDSIEHELGLIGDEPIIDKDLFDKMVEAEKYGESLSGIAAAEDVAAFEKEKARREKKASLERSLREVEQRISEANGQIEEAARMGVSSVIPTASESNSYQESVSGYGNTAGDLVANAPNVNTGNGASHAADVMRKSAEDVRNGVAATSIMKNAVAQAEDAAKSGNDSGGSVQGMVASETFGGNTSQPISINITEGDVIVQGNATEENLDQMEQMLRKMRMDMVANIKKAAMEYHG